MAERIITTHGLLQALKAEDYSLPEGCTEVRLVMGVNAGFLLQFDVYVNQRNLAKLGRALQRLAEDEPVP
jgi:hypothetical protein